MTLSTKNLDLTGRSHSACPASKSFADCKMTKLNSILIYGFK